MRFHFLFLLALALAACTDAGTGGYGPDAANLYAQATQTAASIQVTATAVSANATTQAAYTQATQQALAISNAATVAAAPTVTAQAEYNSVLAIGQATQDAIKADTMRAEATATVIALQATIKNNADRAAMRGHVIGNLWTIFFLLVVIGMVAVMAYITVYMKAAAVSRERERLRPDVIEDGDGRVIGMAAEFRQVSRIPAPMPTRRPEPPQAVYVPQSANSQRRDKLPAMNSVTRMNLNNWLVAICSGTAELNRTSSTTYGIGSEVTDAIIQMALDSGHAEKGPNRNDPVYPRDNFEEFVNSIAILPYSNIPPTPTSTHPQNPSPYEANHRRAKGYQGRGVVVDGDM